MANSFSFDEAAQPQEKPPVPEAKPQSTGFSFAEATQPVASTRGGFSFEDASKSLLSPKEEAKIKEDYAISSEMGNIDYAGRLLKRAGKQAAIGFEQSYGGLKRFGNDILGLDNTENKENLDKLDAVTKVIGTPENHAARLVEGAVSSIIQNVPLIAGGMLVAAVAAPAALAVGTAEAIAAAATAATARATATASATALTGMFTQSFGQTYDNSRREGLDIADSTIRGGAFATLEVLGEKFGLGAEIKAIKASAKGIPTKELAGYFAKALAKEIPGEELTYAGQFAVDKGYGLNPEAGIKEFFNGALDTLAGTVLQGGMMMGAGAGVNKAVRALGGKPQGEENAKRLDNGPIPGTDQLSLPLSSEAGIPSGGTKTTEQSRLDLLSEDTGAPDGREEQLDNKLEKPVSTGTPIQGRDPEVFAKIEGIQAQINTLEDQRKQIQDPNDPEIHAINQEINSLEQAKKDIDRPAGMPPTNKEIALNAPSQQGFTFDEANDNTQRTITPSETSEFGLTAPEGKTNVTGEATPIEVPNYPTSKLMLVNQSASPVKNAVSFFKSLKPAAVSEDEAKAHTAEVDKTIDAIDEFHKEAKGLDRTKRLQFLSSFVDQYSTAHEDKQSDISRVPSAMAGMNAEQQQAMLSDMSQFPKINTVRGMKEFNKQLDQAMLDYNEAKLGRSRENAILPWQSHEDVSTQKDASELQRLGNISEKYMTPEEKAAKNYLTAHAEFGKPFANAMRAAAFDLGAEQGPVFPGQNKETAQLFRNWAAKNLSPITLAKFDATVEEYRQFGEKIRKREQEAGVKGLSTKTKIMHPSVEARIEANDLNGALHALSKFGTPWQKGLAKALRGLGLKTIIGFNKQNNFAHRLVNQNVTTERNHVLSLLETSFPSVFKEIFSNLSDIRTTSKAFTDLKEGRLGVPKETVQANIGQIDAVEEAYRVGVAILNAKGTYFPHADALTLNRDRGGNTHTVFLHEVLHAATHWALDPANYDRLSPNQKTAVAELERTYKIAKELWKTGNEISSIDEFVVEAYSNPEFQSFLKDIPMPNQKKTLWNTFTEFVRDMFGLNNMLGYTLANANTILQAAPNLSSEARALNAQGKLSGYILDDTFKAGPDARSFFGDVFRGRASWEDVKDHLPTFMENIKDSTRKHLLGGLTLRQLQDIVGSRVPPFKDFIDRMEAMLDDRNANLNKTRDIVKPWMAWQSKNAQKAKILNALMLDATRLGVDPAINSKDARLNKAWIDIGEEGQHIYRQVRDFYKNQLAAHIQILLDRKERNLISNGLTPAQAKISQEYIDLKKHFEQHAVEPYFPLKRFGDYWLQIGKGKSKEFYMFESASERNKFQKQRERQLKDQGHTAEVEAGNGIKKLINENIQDFEFLAKLKELVANETGGSRKELRDNITDSIEQMYLQTLPDQSVRRMFMNREGIQGMNQDMLRVFTASAFRISYQQARLAHSESLYGAVDGAEKYLEGMETKEKKVYGDYVGELQNRLQYMMNPPDTGKIPSFLSNMSFLWYMTSPASAIVNMLGVPAMGIPIVGARYGNGKTAVMMTSYARKFATTGFKNEAGKWAFPSFANKPGMFNDRQQRAFDQFIADGLIDITLTHDIVGLSETPSNLYTGHTQKIMGVLSSAFHGAEKFNREVVAMSAFDLAYEKAKKDGLSDKAAEKKAIDEAKELTYKSMFDYSALNKPRFFQPAYAKVFLQFKQFSQQMTYMLARSAYEGFAKTFDKNELKDIGTQINAVRVNDGQEMIAGKELDTAIAKYTKDFKSEGQKRLLGTLGTTFIFAGATGLPGWAAFSALMEIMHYIYADDEDKDIPFDFGNWFKNWTAETFGGFVGDSISRGVASQATGIDVADRMGLNDMWFRDQRNSPDSQSGVEAFLVSLMGPAVGLVVTGAHALDQLNQGHIGRAIETASPAVIKNSIKAARLGREGAITLAGDELISDFSTTEIAAQALGFQSERLAQKQKANIEEKNMEQEIVKKHDMLLNAMFLAIDTNDDDFQNRVQEKINRFNASNPGMGINGKTIRDSIKRRYKLRAQTEAAGGVRINKKLSGELGETNAYGRAD